MNEEKKCNGYEAMFTFLNEDDFKKHLHECAECRAEHEKMMRVSALIQEAKPFIKEKRKNSQILKAACAACFVVFACLSVPVYTLGTSVYNNVVASNAMTVEEMGLPVDEYGLLYIK